MRTCYEAAPLPQGRCYASRVMWMPEIKDHVVVILYDLEQITALLADPKTAHLPGQMCEAVQNIDTVPPAPKLRLVS